MLRRRRASRAAAAVVLAHALALAAVLALVRPAAIHAAWAPGGTLPGLGSGHIWSVAGNPASPAVVIAGTDNGVYRSENSGVTWAATSLTGHRVWVVGFDERIPNAALAGLDGQGVQRSTDNAKTWTDASAGLPSRNARSLAFGLSMIAVGTSDGVAVSTDGTTWQRDGLVGYDVSALSVWVNTPKTVLLAGVDGAPAAGGGYLFRQASSGGPWTSLNTGNKESTAVASLSASALPANPRVRSLLVCTNAGVFRSTNGGDDWTEVYGSLATPAAGPSAAPATTLTAVAYSPVDPNLAYGSFDAGGSAGGALVRSTDGGLTFASFEAGLPADHEVTAIAVARAFPPLLVAAVNPPGKGGMVYAQTDGTAPTPAQTAPPETAGSLVPTGSAPPTFSATPSPTGAPAANGGSSRFEVFIRWPLPLAVEVLTALGAAWLYITWRQRRHIEGPP